MADQELTDLVLLTTLANADLFFVRDISTGIDKQIAASDMTTLFGGGNFLSHSDTPSVYTGAQSNFVKVNGAGTALEFIADPGYLTDITAELLGDLSDVTITSVASGELLGFTGSEWENQTLAELGIAPATHTHVEADITDLQNYTLVGHTHVEADITDLQAYLLDITAEAFTDLSDTPASYAAAGTFFVRVNAGATALEFVADPGYTVAGHTHVEADITDLQNYALVGHTHVENDITDLQAYLLNINAESIDDLSDVDTTTSAPSVGEHLEWDGSNWVPGAAGGGTFLSLSDTPGSFAAAGTFFVRVNAGATAVEFVADPGYTVAGHTHVEADITDLQNYALVGHTHVEADITDLQAYVLPTDSVDILADVDTTTVTPVSGDMLAWNGTNWVPASGMAPGAHASTHVSLGSDEIDGDVLDIDFVPSNYTRSTAPTEVTTVVELTAHLAGIDAEILTINNNFTGHTHVEADITDLQAYLLNINAESIDELSDVDTTTSTPVSGDVLQWNGTNWVPVAADTPGPHTHVEADITDLQNYSLVGHTHVEADITDLQAYALASVTLTAGEGLQGGGDLTTNRTFDLDINSLTTDGAPDGGSDFVATYDVSAGVHKKVLLDNLPGGGGGVGSAAQSVVQARRSIAFLDAADTWQTLTFDTTDVENNASELDHDDTITSRLTLKKDGPYLIFYAAVVNGTNSSVTESRVIKNGATEIAGSFQKLSIKSSSTFGDLDNQFVYVATAGDYIELQFQDLGTTGSQDVDLDPNAIFGAVRLTGVTNELFTDLIDTPADYTGAASFFVKVNSGASALEFVADPGFITDITGEAFLDLSDTPTVYTGAGSQFVKVNAGATDLEFVADPGFLTNINSENLTDLFDVTITAVGTGELLTFTGTVWENQTLSQAGIATASHTHVEADITDLQAYLLNITGESFLDLADTPGSYAAAGSQFVKVNSGATDLEFVADPGFLLDITGENIGDLNDVTLTTVADGEILRFNGTIWVNNTLAEAGVAPVSHTHVEADITDLQAYLLNINAESIDELSDVDTTTSTPVSGDVLQWNGSNWVPVAADTPGPHTHVEADITDLQNYALVGHTHVEADITDLQAYLLNITNENLGDLSDVVLTTEVDGELLRFNGTNWINNTLAEAGVAPASHTHVEADITDLQNYSLVGHTHVEADITDLQAYLLNITGEDFTDLSDTPANYSGDGTKFVRVNAGATALEFVAIVLGDLPAIALDDLSDVDLTATAPVSGDVLSFNGSDWVPASGMAPGAHAATHISAGTDEIDGDRLDIDFVPSNYTRDTSPSEVTLVVELTAHLKGIDTAIAASGSTDFLGLTDTPANYTAAGSRFVKVNSGATGLEFVADPGFLTDITGEAFNDLSDVVITTVASGEIVKFDGANWINNTLVEAGIAPASHTHVEADITDLQAYLLDITGENIGDLADVTITGVSTGEILGFTGAAWENRTLAELSIANTTHAATHVAGGSDEVDGDRLDIDFVPVNYTRDTSPSEVTLANELTAHLAGIDNEMLTVGSLPKWDRQMASATSNIQTTSTTFVDVPDLTVTTGDLGGGQDGSYLIHFSASVSHASQKTSVEFRLLVDGVEVTESVTTVNFADTSLFLDSQFSWYEDPIINNKIIKVQWRQTKTSGNPAGRTAVMTDRRLIISGVPSNAVV